MKTIVALISLVAMGLSIATIAQEGFDHPGGIVFLFVGGFGLLWASGLLKMFKKKIDDNS